MSEDYKKDEEVKIISLLERKITKSLVEPISGLEEIIKKNRANEEKLKEERIKSNISVLKSYKIKD